LLPGHAIQRSMLGLQRHGASKLEKAILDYLGEFSSPIKVRQYLAAAEKQDSEKYEVELKGLEKQLAKRKDEYFKRLHNLLDDEKLTEKEFAEANEKARAEKAELEARKAELENLLKRARASEAMIERIPKSIDAFAEAFQNLDLRQQKAQFQTILKSATIYKTGRSSWSSGEKYSNYYPLNHTRSLEPKEGRKASCYWGSLFPGRTAFGHAGTTSRSKGKLLQRFVIGIHFLVDFGASSKFASNFFNLLMVRIAGQTLVCPKIATSNRMPPA
jgi:hypothetical protein